MKEDRSICWKNGSLAALALAAFLLAACSSSKTPEELLSDARGLMERRDFPAASIQLKNALQINPEFGEARLQLGRVALEQRDYASAEKELRKALELKVPDEQVLPLLARTLVELGKGAEVNARFAETVLSDDRAQGELSAALGYAAMARNDPEAARKWFDGALALDADNDFAAVGKARLLALEKDYPGARALLAPQLEGKQPSAEGWFLQGEILVAQGEQEKALQAFRKVYEIRPDNLRARMIVASSLVLAQKFDAARAELAALRKVSPAALEGEYLNALILVSEKKFAEAKASVDKVLAKAPEFVPALSLAAAVSFELKSYAQAEQYAEKLVTRGADSFVARRILISSQLNTGRVAKARLSLEPLLKANSKHPEVLALIGQVQMAAGESEAALKSFESSVQVRPDDVQTQTRLGIARLAAGDVAGGVKVLETAARLDESLRTDMLLVLAQMRKGAADAALAAIDAMERKKPNQPLTRNLRGTVLLSKNDQAAARKEFEAALKLQPLYFPAASALARLDLADRKVEQAEKRFEGVLAKDPDHADALLALAGLKTQRREAWAEAERLLDRAAKAYPRLLPVRTAQVQFYLMTDRKDKALEVAKAAAASSDDANTLDLLASVHTVRGEGAAAASLRQRAVDIAPNDALAWVRLGASQIQAGQNSEAEQSLKKALQLNPDMLEAEVVLAAFYRNRKSFDASLQVARSMQKKHPSVAAGFIAEAETLIAVDKKSNAVAPFREAFKRAPDPALLVRLLALLNMTGGEAEAKKLSSEWMDKHPTDHIVRIYLADGALVRGDLDAARQGYETVIRLMPDNVIALNNLAWLLWQKKDSAALAMVERAYRIAPDHPAVLDTYGVILSESGKTDEGIRLMRKALAAAPNSHDLQLNLAKGLIRAKQPVEARSYLEKLAALGRSYPRSAEAAALLKTL